MSRKNLSRTIIEGGRSGWNKYDRRYSYGEERASVRAWLDQIAVDVDDADDTSPAPRRRVHKEFRDKLGPPRRWLSAQVGRPWASVYAELRARFDRRTIAGAHVVDDHMLGWVWRGDVSALRHYRGVFDFHVDEHGILRRGELFGRSYYRLRHEVMTWAAGRIAARTHVGWQWFRRLPFGAPCGSTSPCAYVHHWFDRRPYHRMQIVRERALTRGELRRLERLPDDIRRSIVVRADEVGS